MTNIDDDILYIDGKMKNKILALLVLNNKHLSNTQKYAILKDVDDLNVYSIESVIQILCILENDSKSFEEIIFSLLNKPIYKEVINENIIDLVLNSNLLSLEIKIKWIKSMTSNISTNVLISSGVLVKILQFIQNDSKLLLDILLSKSCKMKKEKKNNRGYGSDESDESDEPYSSMSNSRNLLYDILCNQQLTNNDHDILQKYIINNVKLSNQDKLSLFKNQYNGKSILHEGCNKYSHFEQIFNFLRNNDTDLLIEILSSPEMKIIQNIQNKPNEMEIILEFINSLNNESQIKILNDFQFLFKMKGFMMITKILSMLNETIISKLSFNSNNGITAIEYALQEIRINSYYKNRAFDDGVRWMLLNEYDKYIKLDNKKKKQFKSFQQFINDKQIKSKYFLKYE